MSEEADLPSPAELVARYMEPITTAYQEVRPSFHNAEEAFRRSLAIVLSRDDYLLVTKFIGGRMDATYGQQQGAVFLATTLANLERGASGSRALHAEDGVSRQPLSNEAEEEALKALCRDAWARMKPRHQSQLPRRIEAVLTDESIQKHYRDLCEKDDALAEAVATFITGVIWGLYRHLRKTEAVAVLAVIANMRDHGNPLAAEVLKNMTAKQ